MFLDDLAGKLTIVFDVILGFSCCSSNLVAVLAGDISPLFRVNLGVSSFLRLITAYLI